MIKICILNYFEIGTYVTLENVKNVILKSLCYENI